MRKTAAIVLLLALLTAIFASCDKDEEETTFPPLTGATTTAPTTVYTPITITTTQSNTNPTYILTTSPDKTVPWGETTAFSTTAPTTTAPTGIVIQIPTEGVTNPVRPSYSQAPTTVTTTVATTVTTTGSSTSESADDQPTTEFTTAETTTTEPTTTKPVVKKKVSVDTGSSAFNGEETLIVDIDGTNWSSQFVSNTQYLPAYIDGNNTGKNVKCTLNGKPDSANNYTITVDVSSLSLSPGAVISISFPEGFIQTKAGTQYSSSFEINSTY